VQDNLHFDLLGREATLLKGMFLVDEFDGDDGLGRIDGYGFADRSVCALADCFADEAEGEVRGQRSDLTLCSC
jgi:hypothetical protein